MRWPIFVLVCWKVIAAWDTEQDECNFIDAQGKFALSFTTDQSFSDKRMPYYCTNYKTMVDGGAKADGYLNFWWNDPDWGRCPCQQQQYWSSPGVNSKKFWCRSGFSDKYDYCYREIGACPLNAPPLGYYRVGCGCDQDPSKSMAGAPGQGPEPCSSGWNEICPDMTRGCTKYKSFTGWWNGRNTRLKVGDSLAIPPSAMDVKTCCPCPNGYWAKSGDLVCCLLGREFSDDRTTCKPNCLKQPPFLEVGEGWRYEHNYGSCRVCTRCDLNAGGYDSEWHCPGRDYRYARNPDNNGCELCLDTCPPGQYLPSTCALRCVTAYTDLFNKPTLGTIPFQAGYQRVVAEVGKRGTAGKPAKYVPCPSIYYTQLRENNMRVIGPPSQRPVGHNYTYEGGVSIDRSDISRDCNSEWSGECLNNTIPVWVTANEQGEMKLQACWACEPGEFNAGGLVAKCGCAEAQAKKDALRSALNISNLDADASSGCISCLTAFSIKKEPVAIMCPIRGKPYLCAQGEQATSSGCVACPPGTGSRAPGYKCETCLPGFYGPGHTACKSCSEWATNGSFFSNVSSSSACLPTKTRCTENFYLLPPSVADAQRADATCVPCGRCDPGYIMVAQTGHVPTCQGGAGEQNYMGCVSLTELHRKPPNVRLHYTYKDDKSISHFTEETCSDDKLPPYASYVPIDTEVPGAQCYFACQYGVRDEIAQQYRNNVTRLTTVDQDIFLKAIDVPSTSSSKPRVEYTSVWHDQTDYTNSWYVLSLSSSSS